MKLTQILDNVADLKDGWGEDFVTELELNGKLQKEYCGLAKSLIGIEIGFACGPETVGGYLSDSACCDEWLRRILTPLQPTLFPDGCLNIGAAENSHSIFYFPPNGTSVTTKQAEDIWKAIEAKIDEEFDKLPELPDIET